MASLVDLENFLDPCDDFVRGGVRWLVQIDHTVLLENVNGSIRWRVAARQGREVRSLDVQLVEVLEKHTGKERYQT